MMPDGDLSKLSIDKTGAPLAPRRRKRRLILFAAITIAAVAVLVRALGIGSATEVRTATVVQAYPSQAITLLNASGYVVAQRKAAVASKTTGRLEWLGVEEGSRVRTDQVVARLEGKDLQAARDQAAANLRSQEAALDQAKAELDVSSLNYKRSRELFDRGFIAQNDLDASQARYRTAVAATAGAESSITAARAALKAAEVAVEYTLIRAPFDAVVLTKNADIGDIITPLGAAANAKAAVVTIADMASLQVEVDVSESSIGRIRIGQPCEVQLDALPDSRFRGEVHMIVPTADRAKAAVMVKVRFVDRDPRIVPEMSAKVAFLERPLPPDELKPRTAVPPSVIVRRDGAAFAYVVRDDRAVETAVTTGAPLGDLVEITDGLTPGDRVIDQPAARLRGGARVRAVVR